MTRPRGAAVLACCGVLAACSAVRRVPSATEAPPCPAAATSPAAAACARDEGVRSLRARFRAEVETTSGTRDADGVLVWQAPGSLRVKLFTLAGLTVYDALWSGDETALRGLVRLPTEDRVENLTLAPGESAPSVDADLSLVLWALWRPRCAAPPAPAAAANGFTRLALDASPARAQAREVLVADGLVREEVLVRGGVPGTERDAADRVVVRYEAYDCSAAPPLPQRLEIAAPVSGWRARVTILEQARNVELDPGPFAFPTASAAR